MPNSKPPPAPDAIQEMQICAALGYLQDAGPGQGDRARRTARADEQYFSLSTWAHARTRYLQQLHNKEAQEDIELT